jgi:hypothetical protein
MSEKPTDRRNQKLRTVFVNVLSGRQEIVPANAKLFIEAICQQSDSAVCVEKLVASTQGLPSLQAALRYDASITSLNGPITAFLLYLQARTLQGICGGEVLRQIISTIVEPPLIWNAFIEAVKSGHITEDGLDGFSWLLLRLMSLPTKNAILYAPVAREDGIKSKLLGCSRLEVRTRAHRILHIADTITTEENSDMDGPGGRHDNDFADIRKISILPTADELASKEAFLRRAADVQGGANGPSGLALHIDNQFRLLREDMLRDLRKEVDMALSSEIRPRRGVCIDFLSLDDVLCDGRQPWSLRLRCTNDLPQLQKLKNLEARKKFLKDNPKFLKHQSVACLITDQGVVALATLVRDEDLLAEHPAVLCLQLPNTTTEKTLIRMKKARNLRLVQLGTAVFSYEPILQQLKEIKELTLEDDILHWEQGRPLVRPSYELSSSLRDTITRLEGKFSIDLQQSLSLPSSTKLDKSQATCFIAGLRQRVSVMQGPPGEFQISIQMRRLSDS